MNLPLMCTRRVVPLVSVYFDTLYGLEPPHTIHAFSNDPASVHNPGLEWVHLPLDDLVSRLHRLTMDILSASILPPAGRPSINRRSRRRTCVGLIQHILSRACCLETATDKTDNYYLVQILEHEYGQVIIGTLATSPQTRKAEAQKVARRDKRIGDVSAAQLASAAYDRDWPSVIPQNVVLSCLNQYYEGSKWTKPPVCAVCGEEEGMFWR
ncbi:hypothetical protein V8E55_010593 [Tylopilus felleus]